MNNSPSPTSTQNSDSGQQRTVGRRPSSRMSKQWSNGTFDCCSDVGTCEFNVFSFSYKVSCPTGCMGTFCGCCLVYRFPVISATELYIRRWYLCLALPSSWASLGCCTCFSPASLPASPSWCCAARPGRCTTSRVSFTNLSRSAHASDLCWTGSTGDDAMCACCCNCCALIQTHNECKNHWAGGWAKKGTIGISLSQRETSAV